MADLCVARLLCQFDKYLSHECISEFPLVLLNYHSFAFQFYCNHVYCLYWQGVVRISMKNYEEAFVDDPVSDSNCCFVIEQLIH